MWKGLVFSHLRPRNSRVAEMLLICHCARKKRRHCIAWSLVKSHAMKGSSKARWIASDAPSHNARGNCGLRDRITYGRGTDLAITSALQVHITTSIALHPPSHRLI